MNRKLLYKILSLSFVLLLFVPCLGIFREKRNIELIAEMENRTIASKPVSTIFSSRFFHEFEEWYNDRLLGRKDLIRLWSSINGKLFNTLISKEVVMGKDGFLFFPFNLSDKLVDAEEKLKTLNQINELCKESNSEFIVFLAPPSEWIFGDLLPSKYAPVDLQKLENETGAIFKKNGIDYCFIGSTMASLDFKVRKGMYYAGDSHWNENGAFYGACKLLKHLDLDDKVNSAVSYKPELGFGDIYTRKIGWEPIKSIVQVPWSNEFVDIFDIKYNISNQLQTEFIKGASQKGEVIYTNNNARNKVKVLILGDSFFSCMAKYLLQDIHTIIMSHNCDVSAPKVAIDISDMLMRYKPDMVIYEKVGSSFYGHGYDAVFGNMKL